MSKGSHKRPVGPNYASNYDAAFGDRPILNCGWDPNEDTYIDERCPKCKYVMLRYQNTMTCPNCHHQKEAPNE